MRGRVIPHFSLYRITVRGRVFNRRNGKELKGSPNEEGYLRVYLKGDDGKYRYRRVCRLVLIAYVGLDSAKPKALHGMASTRITTSRICDGAPAWRTSGTRSGTVLGPSA